MQKKIMLLGSGELGKEFVIAAKRLGQYVVAVDNYDNAPAMQMADEREVIDMLDSKKLDAIIKKHKPDIIVPEIEAIQTDNFKEYEKKGIQIVPSAKAAKHTMDRRAIRDLVSLNLDIRTAKYEYASDLNELKDAAETVGYPCVIKPLMSSSGKGQTVAKTNRDLKNAWDDAIKNGRGNNKEVIVEELVDFHTEVTLLTVTQKNGPTLFCPPIGHRQENGDYQESWQPASLNDDEVEDMQKLADIITKELGGASIWGVEFFIARTGVYFSEISPRPHDTGMVTLAGTQNFNEFELHLRAILGLNIPEILLEKAAASYVISATDYSKKPPTYSGFETAAKIPNADFKIFGKPATWENRRMGVALVYNDDVETSVRELRAQAKKVAQSIKVNK